MRLGIRRWAVLGAALAVGTPAGADADVGLVIGKTGAATRASAYDGRLIWSELEGRRHGFRLMQRYRGRTTALPIPPRRVSFDADLGPDRRGRTVAVYSRCRGEHMGDNGVVPGAGVSLHNGCRLYVYSFASRRERPVTGISKRGYSDTLPTIWHGRIAFARHDEYARTNRARIPRLMLWDGRRTRQLAGGTTGRIQDPFGNQYSGGPQPLALELGRRGLAFVWNLIPPTCGGHINDDRAGGNFGDELWLNDLHGRARRIGHACEGEPNSLFGSPMLDASTLTYSYFPGGSDIHVVRLRRLQLSDGSVSDTADLHLSTRTQFAFYGSQLAIVGAESVELMPRPAFAP